MQIFLAAIFGIIGCGIALHLFGSMGPMRTWSIMDIGSLLVVGGLLIVLGLLIAALACAPPPGK